MSDNSSVKVFFSYANQDEVLRDELAKHLKILERKEIISSWHDRCIQPGQEIDKQISCHLDSAQIILFLVTADFIASDYCQDTEVKRAIRKHNSGDSCLIPILLRNCLWSETPFGNLRPLPSNNKFLTDWESRDKAFTNIAEGIRKIAIQISQKNESLIAAKKKSLNEEKRASEKKEFFRKSTSENTINHKERAPKNQPPIFKEESTQSFSRSISAVSDVENLYLAWKRILTSTGQDYKQLNLEIYDAFGWNLEEKLELFSSEIKNNGFHPSTSSKYYLPKQSGLIRPISILSIKDQLFYQALTNILCQSKLDEIKRFRGHCLFGGFNVSEPNSIFFLARWQNEYEKYKEKVRGSYNEGYHWVCKFDFASFYDVIDHSILVEIVAGNLDDDLKRVFLEALNVWSKPKEINFRYSQGIPQGPCASQVLADLYLHYLDDRMQGLSLRKDFKYFRYVDDIILMSKEENTLRSGLVSLDIIARELSLIPQSGKVKISKPKKVSEFLKGENSLIELHSSTSRKELENKSLQKIFKDSFSNEDSSDNKKIVVKDETGLKYSLYRLQPFSWVQEIVLKILVEYPHLVDTCIFYLNKFEDYENISAVLIDYINSRPVYEWCVAKTLEHKLFRDPEIFYERRLIGLSISNLEEPNIHWILKRSYLNFIRDVDEAYSIFPRMLEKALKDGVEGDLPYILSLISVTFEVAPEKVKTIFDDLFKKQILLCDEIHMHLGYLLASKGYEHQELNSNSHWFMSNYFLEDSRDVDGVLGFLVDFYGLPVTFKLNSIFHEFLPVDEYHAALHNAYHAKGYYETEPELYVLHSDSLHQIILAEIMLKQDLKISKYEMGNMISKMKNLIPMAYPGLSLCHEFRGYSNKTHAYNQSSNQVNIKPRKWWIYKRNELKSVLSVSYRYLLDYIQSILMN